MRVYRVTFALLSIFLGAAFSVVWPAVAQAREGSRVRVRSSPKAPQLGDPFLLHVEGVDPGVRTATVGIYEFETHLFAVAPGYLQGVGAVPVDIQPGTYTVKIVLDDGTQIDSSLRIAGRRFRNSRLRVAPKYAKKKLPDALAERLKKEREDWQKLWEPLPAQPVPPGRFVRPTDSPRTSEFGVRRVYNGRMQSQHYGVDLDGKVGDPVRAAQTGRVVASSQRYYSGGTLVLDHGGGLFTTYFHLSKRDVDVGDEVALGQRIGAVGKSGRVTGPHLHFAAAVRVAHHSGPGPTDMRGIYVDPERLLTLDFGPRPSKKPDTYKGK